MKVGRGLDGVLVFPFSLVLVVRQTEIAVLHTHHVRIQVQGKIQGIPEILPEIALSHQHRRTVEAPEQDAHPLHELVATHVIVVRVLLVEHAVLLLVVQFRLFLDDRRIRISADIIEQSRLLQYGL